MKDFAVYLDLDGVLADYGHGMVDFGFEIDEALKLGLNRSGTDHPMKRQMYEAVKGTDFYRNLPLMPGALDLYRACQDFGPIILTAAPKFGATEDDYFLNPYWLGAAYHKRAWVEEFLLPHVDPLLRLTAEQMLDVANHGESYAEEFRRLTRRVPIRDDQFICTTSARKHQFMHRKHSDHQILIDDRIQNVTTWAENGGIGILHVDAATSIWALTEITEGAGNYAYMRTMFPAVEWPVSPDAIKGQGRGSIGMLFDPSRVK